MRRPPSTRPSCAWPHAAAVHRASRGARAGCRCCRVRAGRAVHTPELASRALDNGAVRRVSSPTFVGRAEQLATFDQGLARAAAAEPAALLVAGESGVGKSRLVAEFGERAAAAGARVLTGDCVELGEGELPYAPLVGILRDLQRDIGADALAELAGPGRAELGRL